MIVRRRAHLWRAAALVALLLGLAWWLFGVSVWRLGKTTCVARRVFGRVTRIHVLDETLKEREQILFSWSEPFEARDPATDCAAIFPEHWLDANRDGRWDTWLRRIGPDASGHCRVEYRVDTTLSGKPDWTFTRNSDDYEAAHAAIVARRGF
jgi:hypothetical protein